MIDRACISLNNNCNLKCKYCHFQDKQKDFSSFNIEQLKLIIDNIYSYSKNYNLDRFKLGIVGSGEPLLKSNLILELLKYIEEKEYNNFSIYTITNGTLLTYELLKKFRKYKIKVCISLDGYKELHNTGRMAYDKVITDVPDCSFPKSIVENHRNKYGKQSLSMTVIAIVFESMQILSFNTLRLLFVAMAPPLLGNIILFTDISPCVQSDVL